LGSGGGKYHLTSHAFSRPQSSLSLTRIFPLWSSNHQTERGYINSVALGNATSTGREILVAVDTRIQLWSLRFEGYEELISEEDLGQSIREAIQEFTPATSRRGSGVELDVELLDVVLESSSRVVLLVSYAGVDDENSMMVSNNPRRIYVLVRFSHTANAFAVEDATVVPYQSVSCSLPSPLSCSHSIFRPRVLALPCTPESNPFAMARWSQSNSAMPSPYVPEVLHHSFGLFPAD
jgi:nuclear pore complex protein Nup133